MNYEEDEGIDLSIDASEYDEEQSEEMKTDFNDQQDSKVAVKFKKVFHNCKLLSCSGGGFLSVTLWFSVRQGIQHFTNENKVSRK